MIGPAGAGSQWRSQAATSLASRLRLSATRGVGVKVRPGMRSRIDSDRIVARARRTALLCVLLLLGLVMVPATAFAHATERGFVLLLPTDYYLAGGTAAVAASFLLLFAMRAAFVRRAMATRIVLFAIPVWLPLVTSALSFALMVALIVAGFAGTRDPLENPLPLTVWTIGWGVLTILHALLGNLWAGLNPWHAPYAFVRWLGWRRRANGAPLMRYPEWLSYWPALIGLAGFAWFELIDLAPDNPPRLAWAVAVYWTVAFFALLLFGADVWRARGEFLSVFFRFVAAIAPFRCEDEGFDAQRPGRESSALCRLVLACPGAGAMAMGALPPSGVAFAILTLATVSFDGLSKTFAWLDLIGINPLEFPGRSAVMIENSIGLLAAFLLLLAAYVTAMTVGNRFAGRVLDGRAMLGLFALTILPISIGYHFSHYLTATMVNAQYALAALADPFAARWNLFGLGDRHVTTSFLTTYESVSAIWKLQAGGVVLGHIVAVALAHAIAVGRIGDARRALASQMPLAVLMVAYTLFGLWLLAAPTAG